MGTLTRAFAAPTLTVDQPGAGGLFTELTGKVVPYNEPTLIGAAFWEEWAPGAFRESLAYDPRLPLHVFHGDQPGYAPETPWPIAVAAEWYERADGLYSRWALDSTADAQDIAGRVDRGMLNFMSIRFMEDPLGDIVTRRPDGMVQVRRTRARLISVSLVSTPAYPGAVVTGVRSADPLQVVDAAEAVFALAVQLGKPLMVDAITGTPAEQKTAAGLVRSAVERFGASYAAVELAQIAQGLRRVPGRGQLAVNVERARLLIDPDTMAPQLRAAHLDYWRGACGLPAGGTAVPGSPRPAPRRRRRPAH